jgi:serine/threonine protein kinase
MTIYCPNYRCHLQQNAAKICTNCGTALDIYGSSNGQSIIYQLTKILQDSSGKIRDDGEYCWYELFQAQANGANFVIKMLIIVPDRLSPSNTNHISKVKKRFQREYDLLCKGLQGVCKVYEILDVPVGTEMVRSIVMEEVSGLNLEEYVEQNRPIDSQRAIRWLKQLAPIIHGLHKNKVQHRDIKPSNIMVSGTGAAEKLTLIDFGIAFDTSTDQTTQQAILGTPSYKDPVATDKYRDDSDLYSLGKTLIYLLTGQKPPYPDDWCWYDDNNITHPRVDNNLKSVIQRMISVDRSKRFKNAAQLLKIIENRYLPKWLIFALLIILGLVSSLAIYFWSHPPVTVSTNPGKKYMHPICKTTLPHKAEINCGQKTPEIISANGTGVIENAFLNLNNDSSKSRDNAVNTYRQEWLSSKGADESGELLIYLNNAEVQKGAYDNNSQEVYTLLVSVPDYKKPHGVTRDLLSGIAQSQKYFNKNSSKIKLYIAILKEPLRYDDSEIREIVTEAIKAVSTGSEQSSRNSSNSKISQKEISNSKFIGAVGHYSSQVTFNVLDLYAKNKIFLISPSATRSDIPDSLTTTDDLKYFARLIYNGRGQVREIVRLLHHLSTDKVQSKKSNESHCGLINTTLIYEKGDTYAKSVGNELKYVFALNRVATDRNVLMIPHEYELGVTDQEEIKKKIINWIQNDFKSTKIAGCTAMQTVVFIPGAHTRTDPGQIIEDIFKNLPDKVSFIGNITVADILSSEEFKNKISKINPNFYERTYIAAPYSILNFLPSYFTPEKSVVNENFFKQVADNEIANGKDILDIQWRKISGADSIFTFAGAITEYSQNIEKYKSKPITEAMRDIIKKVDSPEGRFSTPGFFGQIEFDDYERKNIKKGTTLRYIPYQNQDKKMALVPLDYREKGDLSKDVEKYKPLKFEDFVPQNTRATEQLEPSKSSN